MKKYRSWPAGISIIYILFVVILLALVIFSSYHSVDLVAKDYYEQEIKYQQQIDRINRADSLSAPVSWHHDKEQRLVTIQFPMELIADDVEGNILFFRPSDAKQDKLMALRLSSKNIQTISTQHLIPGLWKLKIFWQIDQKDFYAEGILVI